MLEQFITHNWRFHLDEVTAFSIISYIYPNITLIRTRDDILINEGINDNNTIIADVWKILDYKNNCFDHHFYNEELEQYINMDVDDVEKTLFILHSSISNTIINKYKDQLLEIKKIWKKWLINIVKKAIKRYFNSIEINTTIESFLVMHLDTLLSFLSDDLSASIWINSEDILSLLNSNKIEIKLIFLENIQYRKYSSAWLIWKCYWYDFITTLLNREWIINDFSEIDIENIFMKIDRWMITEIDLEDNWFIRQDKKINTLSWLIASFWLENLYSEEQDIQFKKVMNIIKEYLYNIVIKQVNVIYDKKLFIREFEEWKNIQIFSKYINWIEKILYWETINYVDYIVYPWEWDRYNIKTIKKGIQYWEHVALPKEWLINSPEWMIFCHNGLFIAQFDNLDTLLNAINYN